MVDFVKIFTNSLIVLICYMYIYINKECFYLKPIICEVHLSKPVYPFQFSSRYNYTRVSLILPRPGLLQSCSSIDFMSCRTNYLSRNPSFQLESFLLFNRVKLLLHYFVFVYYLHNLHTYSDLLFMMYSGFRIMVVLYRLYGLDQEDQYYY